MMTVPIEYEHIDAGMKGVLRSRRRTVVEDSHAVVVRWPWQAIPGVLLHLFDDGVLGGELDVGRAYRLGLVVVGPIPEYFASVDSDGCPAVLGKFSLGHGGGFLRDLWRWERCRGVVMSGVTAFVVVYSR